MLFALALNIKYFSEEIIHLHIFVRELSSLVLTIHELLQVYEHYSTTSCKAKQHFRGAEMEVW